jgi:hypothetical protein
MPLSSWKLERHYLRAKSSSCVASHGSGFGTSLRLMSDPHVVVGIIYLFATTLDSSEVFISVDGHSPWKEVILSLTTRARPRTC